MLKQCDGANDEDAVDDDQHLGLKEGQIRGGQRQQWGRDGARMLGPWGCWSTATRPTKKMLQRMTSNWLKGGRSGRSTFLNWELALDITGQATGLLWAGSTVPALVHLEQTL